MRNGPKRRIFVTGSAEGLGYDAAASLLAAGCDVVVHVRSERRLSAVAGLQARGARVVVGDLSIMAEVRKLADALNAHGAFDAVIHNAGVISGPSILSVNVTAPYLLTALMMRPARLIYLSSSMHRGGHPKLGGMDWLGQNETGSYSDSKLFVTTLAMAAARHWPDVLVNAVDPGWVPTRMGGRNAPDNLELGHVTQAWLAISDDPRVLTSGGYWHHQRMQEPHKAVHDPAFQDQLLAALAGATGTEFA